MTTIQAVSLVWLALIFFVSLRRHINLGLIMLPATYIFCEYAKIPLKELYSGFPIRLMLLILGVTYLWNHVQESGLTEILVKKTIALARGRVCLLPWAMGLLAGIISAVGALPAAAVALVAPVAVEMAKRERIQTILMGIIIVQGACIGGGSPLNPWGSLVGGQVVKNGIAFYSGYFWLLAAISSLAIAVLGYFCFGGLELIKRPAAHWEEARKERPEPKPVTRYQIASALGMGLFIALVLMKYDIGLTAFAIGMALQVAFRVDSKKVISKLPWGIAIMIGGVLTYVNILEHIGVMHVIGDRLAGFESASLVKFGVLLIGTIVAQFESSSIAVLGLVIPIAMKSFASGTTALTINMQLAILYSCIVCMMSSPFHIGGALILSEDGGCQHTYKGLLKWVVSLTFLLPFVALAL